MNQSNEFKKRIVYQIYPSSFNDANNDGWGDLKGITAKLDYLKDLGIGIIWLSPIYVSPMDDMGYDIADYKNINPRFGTMADFDELLLEANKRDIKIVMDLVINHTSTEHEWFKKAIETPENKYRNYYFIKEGKGKNHKKEPNNWQSCFTGKAWEKIPSLPGYFYMHLYCDTQADLNYSNPEVIKEVEDILKFWLDKGVYGFRCDVINHIYKSSLKNDYSHILYNKGLKYYSNQDEMFKILTKFRTEVLDNYDTFLVGETGELDKESGNRFLNERCLDMFFEFDHVYADKSKLIPVFKRKFNVKRLVKPIFKWQKDVPWIANYLENHDQLRSVNRYGDATKYHKESAKMLAIFLLSLKGTPFIYQGEEIGSLNIPNASLKDCKDVAAITTTQTVKRLLKVSESKAFKMVNETINRDHARTPMQWANTVNGGFNAGSSTWLKVNPLFETINVEDEQKDPTSILNFYKKIIKFRNESDVLKFGEFKEEALKKDIVSFFRIYNGKTYQIILNFSDKKVKFDEILTLKCLISNYDNEVKLNELPPYFGGIFEVL